MAIAIHFSSPLAMAIAHPVEAKAICPNLNRYPLVNIQKAMERSTHF